MHFRLSGQMLARLYVLLLVDVKSRDAETFERHLLDNNGACMVWHMTPAKSKSSLAP